MKPRAAEPAVSGASPRLAWLLSFVITIALIVLLGAVRSAEAMTLPAPGSPAAGITLAPWEEEEGEFEEKEEEFEIEGEEEFEGEAEGEGEEAEGEGEAGVDAAEGCLLRSAGATVTAVPARNRVRLAVHYTTFYPAIVAFDYRLRGGLGSFKLGADTERFSRRGVLRHTDELNDAQMRKAMAAKEFTVHLHAVNTPRSCQRDFDRHLTRRHGGPSRRVWSAPPSRPSRPTGR